MLNVLDTEIKLLLLLLSLLLLLLLSLSLLLLLQFVAIASSLLDFRFTESFLANSLLGIYQSQIHKAHNLKKSENY